MIFSFKIIDKINNSYYILRCLVSNILKLTILQSEGNHVKQYFHIFNYFYRKYQVFNLRNK